MSGTRLRRRDLGAASGVSYPIISNYPALTDFGMYQLTPVRVMTNDNVNTFVKSGDNSFPDMGWKRSTEVLYVYITDSFVMLTGMGSTQFCGFPVRVKRCINGTESEPGVTYFSVTKISS